MCVRAWQAWPLLREVEVESGDEAPSLALASSWALPQGIRPEMLRPHELRQHAAERQTRRAAGAVEMVAAVVVAGGWVGGALPEVVHRKGCQHQVILLLNCPFKILQHVGLQATHTHTGQCLRSKQGEASRIAPHAPSRYSSMPGCRNAHHPTLENEQEKRTRAEKERRRVSPCPPRAQQAPPCIPPGGSKLQGQAGVARIWPPAEPSRSRGLASNIKSLMKEAKCPARAALT